MEISKKESEYIWHRICDSDFENKHRFWPVFDNLQRSRYHNYYRYVQEKFAKLKSKKRGTIENLISSLKMYNKDTKYGEL